MVDVDGARTAYDVLGVHRDVDLADLKRAFRALSKKHHPDLPGGDADVFAGLSVAYETLRDHRAEYDDALATARTKVTEPVVEVPEDWEPEAWDETPVADEEVAWEAPAVRAPLETYATVTRTTFTGRVTAIVIGVVSLAASFAVTALVAGDVGVNWVVYCSVAVLFGAFLRAAGLPVYLTTLPELALSALMIWGAASGHGPAGGLTAAGILIPLVIAGEAFNAAIHGRGTR